MTIKMMMSVGWVGGVDDDKDDDEDGGGVIGKME